MFYDQQSWVFRISKGISSSEYSLRTYIFSKLTLKPIKAKWLQRDLSRRMSITALCIYGFNAKYLSSQDPSVEFSIENFSDWNMLQFSTCEMWRSRALAHLKSPYFLLFEVSLILKTAECDGLNCTEDGFDECDEIQLFMNGLAIPRSLSNTLQKY